ncbi:MAG TPA: bacteriohopanetetrol glucosamine biosynthesis glycosyltransferase HpnI [Terriglobales bacterium]|nr:bacteriohopanetetrol glucosamine biosynthesis glycosyltransferase HpnI [Terriglobales bacterium]
MAITPVRVVEILSAAFAVCGISYNLLCIWSGRRFAQNQRVRSNNIAVKQSQPPVSILKPLRGTDPEMLESLRSHCLLQYPAYEILFAVHDPDDPALSLVERLKSEFPERDVRIFVCPHVLGANIKVSNLVQLLPHAKYEYLVVNDSDIRVAPDYLSRVIAPFADNRVGMVTCLYRGVAERTLWSKLESLGISTDFCLGVLVANALEGEVRFALGSTLAFRRQELVQVGGFESLVDYLADDYELGARISQTGRCVQIADTVVETSLPRYSWREFVAHQLRWERGIRASRPGGYFGLCLTYVVPWAILTLLFARGMWWSWLLLAIALVVRLAAAFTVGVTVLKDPQVQRFWWLIPIRDCIALVLWAWAYTGSTVQWRGDRFVLRKGKLIPAAVPAASTCEENK